MNKRRRGAAGGGGVEPFSIAFTDTDSVASSSASTTFNGVTLGDDVTGSNVRYTVIAVMLRSGGTFVSGTIAGASASLVSDGSTSAQGTGSGGSNTTVHLIIADTTGLGATGDVALTWTGANSGALIAAYRMINPMSDVADDVTVDTSHSSGLVDLSLVINSGGSGIACTMQGNGGTATWTGMSEDVDTDIGSNEFASSASGGSPGTPHTVTMQSADTTPGNVIGVSASWS